MSTSCAGPRTIRPLDGDAATEKHSVNHRGNPSVHRPRQAQSPQDKTLWRDHRPGGNPCEKHIVDRAGGESKSKGRSPAENHSEHHADRTDAGEASAPQEQGKWRSH